VVILISPWLLIKYYFKNSSYSHFNRYSGQKQKSKYHNDYLYNHFTLLRPHYGCMKTFNVKLKSTLFVSQFTSQ